VEVLVAYLSSLILTSQKHFVYLGFFIFCFFQGKIWGFVFLHNRVATLVAEDTSDAAPFANLGDLEILELGISNLHSTICKS